MISSHWDSKTQQLKIFQGIEYAYDKNGNQTLIHPYNWISRWVDGGGPYKYERLFDDKNNEIYAVRYYWGSHTLTPPYHLEWQIGSKTETTYNQHNKPTTKVEIVKERHGEAWKGTPTKQEYFYNENQALTLIIHYSLDTINNSWKETGFKDEFCYDEQGNLISGTGFMNTVTRYYREYTYNQNNQKILELIYRDKGNQRTNHIKDEYRYDERGNMEIEARYVWDAENEEWEKRSKKEYKYDERGNQLLSANYWGRKEENTWVKWMQEEKAYDENNNIILKIQMNGAGNELRNGFKKEYEYIHTNLIKRELNYRWEYETQQWQQYAEFEYFYSSGN